MNTLPPPGGLEYALVVFVAALLIFIYLSLNRWRHDGHLSSATALYNLDHAQLNFELPPKSMWTNMGFWKNTTDFPSACSTLLYEVLSTAGLMETRPPTNYTVGPEYVWADRFAKCPERTLRILDVGIGCGDQTMHLLRPLAYSDRSLGTPEILDASDYATPISHYVGITNDPLQHAYAKARLHRCLQTHPVEEPVVEIFCADAANPQSCLPDLSDAISHLGRVSNTVASPTSRISPVDRELGHQPDTWLLAIDSLYHFRPSRLPILTQACNELDASLAAFDLLLADDLSRHTRRLVRILSLLLGCPQGAFMTEGEYRGLVREAGYVDTRDVGVEVVIRDVSADTFGGLAGFLSGRADMLSRLGLGSGLKWRICARLFRWCAEQGPLRACIVVVRKSRHHLK